MPAPSPPLFGQPRGLTVLFLTQMWETFSYYGMRALLVYYMTQQLLFAQPKASMIYGVYTAMVFFTPIIGGVISDRWLGRRRAVLIGGSIMALGHFLLAGALGMAWTPLGPAAFFALVAGIAALAGLLLNLLDPAVEGLSRNEEFQS